MQPTDTNRKVTAYVGLGANVGDRRGQIEAALGKLAEQAGVVVEQVSNLRETAAQDGAVGQAPYLNGVARVVVEMPATALLELLKRLECEAGRSLDAPRNAPRPLDLDILLYGEERIDQRQLQVPHPRMLRRPFVLEPLGELGVDVDALARFPSLQQPQVCKEPEGFAALNSRWLKGDCVTGLVPTMGALHEGHASLMRAARLECDRVAATIFVNPLQFGETEDFDSYPRSFEADLEVLRREGVDAVFVPRAEAMYPEAFASRVRVGREAEGLEGASRPGHFEGVATLVAKLFALARPTYAYFGQKDAQQVAVLRRLVQDLGFHLGLRVCPVCREADGLAMSSRNVHLLPADRRAATVLYRALGLARELFGQGERDPKKLQSAAKALLAQEPRVRLDYLEIRCEGSLLPLPEGPVHAGRVVVAAYLGAEGLGAIRLIDNVSLADHEG